MSKGQSQRAITHISFQCPTCGHESLVDLQYAGQSGPCVACGRLITIPSSPPVPVAAPKRIAKSGPPVWVKSLLGISGLILGVGLIAVIANYTILPAMNQVRSASKSRVCRDQLERIAEAMHAYHQDHGHFPPAYSVDGSGQPLHSWRVLLLPYLGAEEAALYQRIQINEPWNSPVNSIVASAIPSVYSCPEDNPIRPDDTSYCVVAGPGFLFHGATASKTSDVKDGLANTIMVVETSKSGIHWMEPRDLTAQQWSLGINSQNPQACRSEHGGSLANVAYADAESGQISDVTTPEELRALATIAGGEKPIDEVPVEPSDSNST